MLANGTVRPMPENIRAAEQLLTADFQDIELAGLGDE